MSSMDFIARVTGLLNQLRPDDALQNESFRNAVLRYVKQSKSEFRRQIERAIETPNEITAEATESAELSRKPSKRRRNDESVELRARRYFAEKIRAAKASGELQRNSLSADLLSRAVAQLEAGCSLDPSIFEEPLGEQAGDEATREVRELSNRWKTTLCRYILAQQQTALNEVRRRICLLRVYYEVNRLRLMNCLGEEFVSLAEREFAGLSGTDAKTIRQLRKIARPYAQWCTYLNGLGIQFMLGCQTRHLWERELTELGITWIWEFCVQHLPRFLEKAEAFQQIGIKLVRNEFTRCGASLYELQIDGHIFSEHFRQPRAIYPTLDSSSALDTLATLATRRHGLLPELAHLTTLSGSSTQTTNCFPTTPFGDQNAASGELQSSSEGSPLSVYSIAPLPDSYFTSASVPRLSGAQTHATDCFPVMPLGEQIVASAASRHTELRLW